MEQLRPLPSDLRCALCHDRLDDAELEQTGCASCGTLLHTECAREHEVCPTLACPEVLVPWRFEEAMARRDGPLVRTATWVGASGGGALAAWVVLAGAPWPGSAPEAAALLQGMVAWGLIGAAQGAVGAIFLAFLLRALTTGTPPLRE